MDKRIPAAWSSVTGSNLEWFIVENLFQEDRLDIFLFLTLFAIYYPFTLKIIYFSQFNQKNIFSKYSFSGSGIQLGDRFKTFPMFFNICGCKFEKVITTIFSLESLSVTSLVCRHSDSFSPVQCPSSSQKWTI